MPKSVLGRSNKRRSEREDAGTGHLPEGCKKLLLSFEAVEGTASEVCAKAMSAWKPTISARINMSEGKEEAWDALTDMIYDPANYTKYILELTCDNPVLREVLVSQTQNTHTIDPNRPDLLFKQELRYESTACHLARIKHKDNVPFLCVLDSCEAYRVNMNHDQWDQFATRRILMSDTWTEKEFLPEMHKRYPGAPYEVMEWASFAAFDNFTVKINYKAIKTTETAGYRLDMTNWLTIPIPISILPNTNFRELYKGEPVHAWHD